MYDCMINAFASEFVENHKISAHLGLQNFDEMINQFTERFEATTISTDETEFVSVNYVADLLKSCTKKRSCGFDNIRNILIINSPKIATHYLTFMFNSCLKLHYFPTLWKRARVIPILKSGKPSNLISSYRPISLLSCTGKIFEKIIRDKIQYIITEKNIIPNQQFGFRSQHSTSHQVKRICKHVQKGFERKESTGLVLLDVEKAFDTVWHDGLIFKLVNFGLPLFLIKLVKSFLINRSFSVSINNTCSTDMQISAGVPQGSVIGPLLYILYCSDFPNLTECDYALYADDVGIFTTHTSPNEIISKLQNALDRIYNFMFKWKIKINANKTQAIFFTKKRSVCNLPTSPIRLAGHQIDWCENVKYLGVVLDKKLIFRDHIIFIKNKFNIAIKLLYPLINRNSKLSIANKILLYKAVFQSILLYACPVWGQCANTHIKSLQICQNKVLKMMLKLPWDYSTSRLHKLADIKIISDKINSYNSNFNERCIQSENPLIFNLFE